jgi:redox-regulated HSP33 family molecular chaperone
LVLQYGRTLLSAALLATPLEGEERVAVQFSMPPNSALTNLRAEATAHGELRGTISGAAVPVAESLVDISRPIIQAGKIMHAVPNKLTALSTWNGHLPADTVLSVSRIMYNRTEPAISSVSVGDGQSRGDIQSDLQHLYESSDQLPSSVSLDVTVDPSSSVTYCGGLVAQRIASTGGIQPSGHEWASYEQVADRVSALSLSKERAHGNTLHSVAHRLLMRESPSIEAAAALPAFPSTPIDLFCRCSKPAYLHNLLHSGGRELVLDLLREHSSSSAQSGPDAEKLVSSTGADGATVQHKVCDVVTTLSCGVCNRRHYITQSDLTTGLAAIPL